MDRISGGVFVRRFAGEKPPHAWGATARRCARAVLALAVMSAMGQTARGASWDTVPGSGPVGDGVLNGGAGIWDLTTFNWSNDGGITNTTWVNGDASTFAGMSGGTVRIGGAGVSVGSITFDPTADLSGYTLQSQTGIESLTLAGPLITANQDGAINAILAGSNGLTKLGTASLTLGGANSFSGPVSISAGKLRVENSGALGGASSLAISGGATFQSVVPLNFAGNVSIGLGGGTISLASPAATLSLFGILSGNSPLTIDGSGGGAVSISNPANFIAGANTFTGNVLLVGGGSASLAYSIAAPAGQTFISTAGTLSLGNSVPGATVTLSAGSTASAAGGTIALFGRASNPGVGVLIAGDLIAQVGGRIEVGDGLDDSAQIAFASSAHLSADGGTIVLRPRLTPLTLDGSNLNSLSLRNGGVLALAGNADLVINRDIDQSGAWVLANQSVNTLRIAGGSQDTTAGLTLRAENGLIRFESDAINLGANEAAGMLAVDLRGGTIDINNAAAGKTFTYMPGYTVSGWGQLGTSAINQMHVIPAGGATFYASAPAALGGMLNIVGGINETGGSKAGFRIGDNNGLMLTVPNAAAAPYQVGNVVIDPQGAGNVARFVVGAGGAIRANAAAFINPNNRVRFEVSGGTLFSDISQTGTLLVNTPDSLPINVTSGGTFITSASAFLLKNNETLGTQGTLFGFNGTTITNLTLNGLLDLNGTLGASINSASTGTIKMDAGEILTLGAQADLLSTTLAYSGVTGAATLEVNAPAAVVRLGTAAPLTTPFGPFTGTREFRSTAGTLQVDAADASTVTVTGVNQLQVDRTSNAAADPTLLGTLTLNGGAFQIGASASTTTIAPGGLLTGRGSFGHAVAIDTLINNGTVQASGGQLTISAATIKGNGGWDPAGQTIVLTGTIADSAPGNATTLLITGAQGGKVQLAQSNNYTGGTIIDGSSGASPVVLRVIAAGALGSGPVTLNAGTLQLNSDGNLNYASTNVNVIGAGTSTISYDHIAGTGSRTHSIGALTLGGQTLNLTGPPTSAYNYTLNIASTTVSAAGATIFNTSGSPVNTGPLTLNGNLTLALGSFNFTIGSLSGAGAITRSASSGTLTFNKPASNFSGSLFTSVGTTSFTGANTLFGGTYTFAGGTININNGGAGALNGATGTMRAGPVNLNTSGALEGAMMNVSAGNLTANAASALGTGNLQFTGGKLFLKQNTGSDFGGTINISGTISSSLTVDRSTGAGTGGTHSISALNINSQTLNLLAGNSGYGLAVTGATTITGVTSSNIDNEASELIMPSLVLNGPLIITGTGITSIGQLGGSATLNAVSDNVINLTGAPLAGFNSNVQVSTGTVNLNNAASLAGGSVVVNGGSLNLGVANALAGTSVSLNSGFIRANANNALAGATLPITNGTLFATANNSLGNANVNLTGGNLTATAPGALGSANIVLDGATLALRGDASAAFGGNVTIPGSGFSTISVANLTAAGNPGSILSINNLALGGQTLNITGANNDTFAVINPINLSGSEPTIINATAANAMFQGALTGTGGLIKTGVQTLTLGNGGNFGPGTVSGGTLVINNSWTAPGASVGTSTAPATLELGGGGVNDPGNLFINAGTLRISKVVIANAVPLASSLTVGNAGNAKIEYAGLGTGTLANTITVDTTLAARTLTLSSASGASAAQISTFTYAGQIIRSGANALTVAAQADTALDDGFGNLVRPPSRLVLAGNQTFTTDLQHNGGIVIAKGNIPAGLTASPLGQSANPLGLNVMDSTIGGMVADGQSSATFLKAVTTAGPTSPRKRLGAFYNPSGAAVTQTVTFQAPFTWNDGSFPLYVITPSGNPAGAAAVSTWNGMIADPQTILQISNGATLDNILSVSGNNITAAPIYIGGGGTVRFNSGFDESSYRNLAGAKGLSGNAIVLDNTTLQSSTGGHHFDGIELRTGTYQLSSVNQLLTGGFIVSQSPFDPARNTSGVVADFNLTLAGTGPGKVFTIASGQTLVKSGNAALTLNGDQAHAPNSTLQVNEGTVTFNTDAGMNAAGPAVNNLSLAVALGGTANFSVTQHLAQITLTGGTATLTPGAQVGAKIIKATGVNITTGKLDIANNRLIVDYSSGGSPMATIRQQIIAGYNAGGSLWSGNGIVSSTAAASPFTGSIGYGEASDLLGINGGTFGGESVDSSAILIRYTKPGDADLDGAVGFPDLVRVAQHYGQSSNTLWSTGDFNYDGIVNFQDLVNVAQNYGQAFPSAPIPGASVNFEFDLQAAFATAPEPGTLALLTAAGALTIARRRRKMAR
jgi:autotransporter-associated beta strand protein